MDNKLEKGENFRVEGSLDSDAVSKKAPKENLSGELLKENQKDFDMDTPSGINTLKKSDEPQIGNGSSVSNP